MEHRQLAIEHEHVVADDPRLDQRLVSVGGQIDRHSLASQAAGDRVREAQLIFGDQNAHRDVRMTRTA